MSEIQWNKFTEFKIHDSVEMTSTTCPLLTPTIFLQTRILESNTQSTDKIGQNNITKSTITTNLRFKSNLKHSGSLYTDLVEKQESFDVWQEMKRPLPVVQLD